MMSRISALETRGRSDHTHAYGNFKGGVQRVARWSDAVIGNGAGWLARPPQLFVEIALPAETREIDLAVLVLDTLGDQASQLFVERRIAR